MSFWHSELGVVLGKPDDAYAKTFKEIPDDTTVIAKIASFLNKEYNGNPYLQIEWEITSQDFKGRRVFHKLHVFDQDPKRRHRFLNMLMLAYNLFGLQPETDEPPTDRDLKAFVGRSAGIRIQLTQPNADGRQYNWVSQIAPKEGFECAVGLDYVKAPVNDVMNDKN